MSSLESGVRIGDFRIEGRLGAGGMGIVYRATQVSLGRVVALKVLGPALDRPADIARFRREAQAVARLRHTGIAAVHHVGQDGQACYLAMEFIDGISLRTLIDRLAATTDLRATVDSTLRAASLRGERAPTVRFDQTTATHPQEPTTEDVGTKDSSPSPAASRLIASTDYLRRCGEIARDAALALDHAHQRGVVHRDVKPENLMLDRDLQVYVIDFGVARFFEDLTVTNTGQLVGTPMYMSPEQVTGRLGVDHRTDIYSLGLVLYELLGLRRPIESPSREGILRQVVTKALPPARWRNPAVPRDLANVVHQATAKDPDERYATAAAFAADLQHWLDGRPVEARPYRHRFDPREVVAARPPEVVFAAFWLMFASLYAVLGGVEKILAALVRGGLPLVDRDDVVLLLLGVLYAFVGRGLLRGRAWSRWAGIAVGGFNACLFATYLSHLTWGLGRPAGSYRFSLFAAIEACWLATIAILAGRRVRGWFRFAERLRSEHGRESSTG